MKCLYSFKLCMTFQAVCHKLLLLSISTISFFLHTVSQLVQQQEKMMDILSLFASQLRPPGLQQPNSGGELGGAGGAGAPPLSKVGG